jgi:membrane protein implicated in regulation of membrane protease activity
MSSIELSIWAAMLGALLTFFGAALADALRNPSIAAWRALGFIALVGSSAMLMSGWVEYVADIHQHNWLMPAKVSIGPLSGALALLYLGIWFGKLAQDPWLDRLIHWGSLAQCLAAAALLIALLIWPDLATRWLQLAFVVNVISVAMALSAAARGVALGDRLATAMVVACACLGVMVIGLYAKLLGWASSYLLWGFTAIATAAYFLITTVLTIERNRQRRQITKMSEGVAKADEVTGLPVGGTLLSKVDDALWRSVRIECECAVMAVWISNLYVYNDEIDSSIEHEIRLVLAARIRRAIGFRHVLGLQQSRCFIAGISAVSHRQRITDRINALAVDLQRPLQVGVMHGSARIYQPTIGIGLVFVGLGHMTDPLSAMDQAQALAKKAVREDLNVMTQEANPASALSTRSADQDTRI